MAYRITKEDLDAKPTPKCCMNLKKLKQRVRQLKRDKAGQPSTRRGRAPVVRKWTDRKANKLAKLEERLSKYNSGEIRLN